MAIKSVLSQLVLGSSLLVLSSCNFRDEKVEAVDAGALPAVDPADLNFANVNTTVISPKCLVCHAAAAGNLGGVNLEGYAAVNGLIAAIESTAIVDRSMPQGSTLNATQYALLKAWIEAGAPETAP